jgi:tetratricopeptide (TPR) repeat protein
MRRIVPRRSTGVVVSIALSASVWVMRSSAQAPALPELPQVNLDDLRPTVRKAVEEAFQAAQSRPLDASANGELGMVLHAHDLLPEAEVSYERAHLLDPASFRWAYYLGLVHLGRTNCEKAATAFRRALLLDPAYLPARLRLAQCLRVSAEMEEAGKLYEAIIKDHPDSPHAYYGLGRVYSARNDIARSAELFQKACDLFPNFNAAHYALAHVYQRLGKTDLARKEQALSKKSEGGFPPVDDPLLAEVRATYRDYDAFLKSAELFGGKGKFEDAAAAYEAALEVNPQLAQAHARLIYLYGRLGQAARAEEHFQTAIRLDPNHAEAYFHYGTLLMGQGKVAEAEAFFRKTLEIDPDHAEARSNLGFLLEGRGKEAEAVAEFRKALESKPGFPKTHFSLGRILVKQESYEEGISHLLKSLATEEPETKSSYLHAIGIAFATLGDVENGVRYLRVARRKAAAQNQAQLVETIDEDLRLLGGDSAGP